MRVIRGGGREGVLSYWYSLCPASSSFFSSCTMRSQEEAPLIRTLVLITLMSHSSLKQWINLSAGDNRPLDIEKVLWHPLIGVSWVAQVHHQAAWVTQCCPLDQGVARSRPTCQQDHLHLSDALMDFYYPPKQRKQYVCQGSTWCSRSDNPESEILGFHWIVILPMQW